MNTQDERKAFIEWATSKDLNVDHEIWYNGSTKFYDDKTQLSWEAWSEQAKKLEGCVVVPVEDILNLKRRIEHRYTNANEAINAEGWNPIISGHLDALDWAEQDVSEYLGKYVADVEAARGGNDELV